MIGDAQRAALQQKGYEVIGSHSAVKMCRWTKNALKGQGQCYKHAFYGIASHRCMEATPSLACANRCTFCWRSYANPVAMRWAFDTDDPEAIVQQSLEAHGRSFIRQVVAGGTARADRAEEAAEVRHCALSLVGEPVLYPQVAELINSLHSRRISTFLVTNGQFPQQLEALPRVTQLYVSVDAPTRDELLHVGRPLFADAWGRLLASLDTLAERGRRGWRTVCRLTLCRGGLTREAARGYAELIMRASPGFIEAKGVTPVPQFAKGGLTMNDTIPTHSEVRGFAEMLCEELSAQGSRTSYALACEHRHSNAALLADSALWKPSGQWRTWIDFEAFFDVLGPDLASGGTSPIVPPPATAWSAPTPAWALWNAPEAGLDPEDTPRLRQHGRPDDFVDLALRGPARMAPAAASDAAGAGEVCV